MTKEEIEDLLKFIIHKCDLIINNENYTADEYAQDKVEDIAEMCHRVLDGQFGEIIEPSLPSDLDEAAKETAKGLYLDRYNLIWMFKAGAKWMAGQGVNSEGKVFTSAFTSYVKTPGIEKLLKDAFPEDTEVTVQIRKKQ